jgi:predicted aspartyl protease
VLIEFPQREIKTELGVLLDPTLELPVKTPGGNRRFRFLLDSGTDFTMMPRSAARQLGLSLKGTKEMSVTGIEGSETTAWLSEITVEIGGSELPLPCLFSSIERTPYLLGRMGFFQRFNITFDNARKKIILEDIGR